MRRIFGSWNRKSAGSPYTLLKTENEEIRLATLAPGDYDDTIVIRLRIKSLSKSKAPNYEALSYAWGTDISPHNALVNGKAISISANLDSGLRHLRYEDKSRVLWIDALCIDQTDILERNSQVQLMSCIYSEARTVLIWLGPSDGDDEEAMRKIAVWQKHWDLPFFKALIRICKRPWFQRLWVVQELTLASTNPMVHLGYVLVPWDKFHNFIRATSDGTMGTKWDYVAPKGSDLHFEFWTAAKRIVSLGEMRQNRSFADFADNLADTAEFEATDARDKVYGILAMKGSSASTPAITPDYTKTIREVFVESIFYLIREDPVTLYKRLPLHPLRKEHSKPPSTALGLPSWAMDLTITSRNPDDGHFYNRPILLTPGYIYSTMSAMAQKGLQSIARLSSNNTLHAVGAFIGSIVITSEDLLLSTHTDYRAPGSVPISIKTLHGIYNNMLKPRNISTESLLRALCSSTKNW